MNPARTVPAQGFVLSGAVSMRSRTDWFLATVMVAPYLFLFAVVGAFVLFG